MIEIRWHGRGGQGAFTAARLLGNAVSIYGGKYALAFPTFGPERRGAPVMAFTRIDENPITDRSEVNECDAALVLDDTLFGDSVKKGLKPGSTMVINTIKASGEFQMEDVHVITVDATGLALEILGRPITNVPMIGALLAAAGITSLSYVEKAIDDQLAPKIREKNKKLLYAAYHRVKGELRNGKTTCEF
ncbi:MAG: 2-oxoacid:acceptor oxidoreductase family protein [Clostridium sp.]|nr:2-oxoacid:acceptor oxidoreductase family protein [Clostridium sp.]